jgi:hypothetical protein
MTSGAMLGTFLEVAAARILRTYSGSSTSTAMAAAGLCTQL